VTAPAATEIVPMTRSAERLTTQAEATCDMCWHSTADHDSVAARYCNATRANALSRGCICRP